MLVIDKKGKKEEYKEKTCSWFRVFGWFTPKIEENYKLSFRSSRNPLILSRDSLASTWLLTFFFCVFS